MVIFHCTVHNAASPADNKEHTEGMWHYVFVIFHSTKHTSFSLGSYQCKNAENKLLLVLTLRMMHSWSGDFLPILRLPFASTTKACQFDTSPCQPLRRQCKAAPSAASLTQLTRILWMLSECKAGRLTQKLFVVDLRPTKKKVIQFYSFSFPIKHES